MPRGQKSKLRALEKRRQNRAKTQGLESAQAAAGEEEEVVCSFATLLLEGPSGSVGVDTLQGPVSAPATTSAAAGVSCERSTCKSEGRVQISRNLARASGSPQVPGRDLLRKKAAKVIDYVLYQYKMQRPIRKVEMLNIIHKWYRKDFPEILKRAADRIDMFFSLELKEDQPNGNSYTLVERLDDTSDACLGRFWRFPIKGVLMPLLRFIFLQDNRVPEEEMWKFLNKMGFYAGKTDLIFGESRKLLFENLVPEKYLVYRRLPNTSPPRYEFLWGPRAQAETSKMKVLQFTATLSNTDPTTIHPQYEEALKDEEERAQARSRAARTAGCPSKTSEPSSATSSGFPHSQ